MRVADIQHNVDRVADIQHNVDRVEVMELEPEPESPEEVAPLAAAQLVFLGMPGSFDLANLNAGSGNAGISPGCANPLTRRSGGLGQGGQQDTEPRRLFPHAPDTLVHPWRYGPPTSSK